MYVGIKKEEDTNVSREENLQRMPMVNIKAMSYGKATYRLAKTVVTEYCYDVHVVIVKKRYTCI